MSQVHAPTTGAGPPLPPPELSADPPASPPALRPNPRAALGREAAAPRLIASARNGRHRLPLVRTVAGVCMAMGTVGTAWLTLSTFSLLVREGSELGQQNEATHRMWIALVVLGMTFLSLLGPAAYLAAVQRDRKERLWLVIAVLTAPAITIGVWALSDPVDGRVPVRLRTFTVAWTSVLGVAAVGRASVSVRALCGSARRGRAAVNPALPKYTRSYMAEQPGCGEPREQG